MPQTSQLEELISRRQDELLELLTVCRGYLPAAEATRLASRLEFLEGLIRLETDRALGAMRKNQKELADSARA